MSDGEKGQFKREFYGVHQLAGHKLFPIHSSITIKKLIETGQLEAINVSTDPNSKLYRVPKDVVIDFIEKRTTAEKV